MSGAATTEDELLDQLVPPPWPRWRRWTALAVVAALMAATGWAWQTGTATPRTDVAFSSWGGFDPVGAGFTITNESRVPIEIVGGPFEREGLELVGYVVQPIGGFADPTGDGEPPVVEDPFPIRLQPDQWVDLRVVYEVVDCEAIRERGLGDRALEVQVRVADGPFSWFTRTRRIPATNTLDAASTLSEQEVGWPVLAAQYPCRFSPYP